jgi:peptidoglycan/LPS O-acetylase OafA/YrhL
LSKIEFSTFSIVAFLITIWGTATLKPDFLQLYSSYCISFLYAYGIFGVALLLSHRIKPGRFFGFYSKISYSFYVNNGFAYLLISILFPLIGYSFSLGIAFIFLTALAYLSWRFIEQPSKKVISRLLSNSERHGTTRRIS